jgi:hypothetical protein
MRAGSTLAVILNYDHHEYNQNNAPFKFKGSDPVGGQTLTAANCGLRR